MTDKNPMASLDDEIERRLLEARAATEAIPGDLCYVNNFAEPNRPRLLQLPAGRGARLKADMQQFVSELAKAITAAFESVAKRPTVFHINGLSSALKCGLNPIRNSFMNG